MQRNAPPPLSTREVANLHGISVRTVQDAIKQGALRADKLPGLRGSYVLYQRDVDRWLERRAKRAHERAQRAEARRLTA